MNHEQRPPCKPRAPFWRSCTGLVLLGFLSVAAFFLATEHRAHALGALPFLLLALCPLLHLFGHSGHGDESRKGDGNGH